MYKILMVVVHWGIKILITGTVGGYVFTFTSEDAVVYNRLMETCSIILGLNIFHSIFTVLHFAKQYNYNNYVDRHFAGLFIIT